MAVIASRGDLGLVQGLWLKPTKYAPFLGRELRFLYKQRLVIVMPNGFGVYDNEQGVGAEERIVSGIGTQPGAKELAQAMLDAVRKLAAASGHSLPKSGGGDGSVLLDRFLIGGGALVVLILLAVAERHTRKKRAAPLADRRAK